MRVYDALRRNLVAKGSVIIYKRNRTEYAMTEVSSIINNTLISVTDSKHNAPNRYLGGDEEIIVVDELAREARIFKHVTGVSPESFLKCGDDNVQSQ